MKKKELLEKINMSKDIEAAYLNLSIKENNIYSQTKEKQFDNLAYYVLGKKINIFPEIEGLKEEFDILKKEFVEMLKNTKEEKEKIKKCNHEVRFTHHSLFGESYRCIFCGEYIASDCSENFEYSINRNNHCVNLLAYYQDNEDYPIFKDGYTKEDVYNIILEILKDKNDLEEIDLISEFKKLNLPNTEVIDRHDIEENYILIIGGSNKEYIDKETFIFKKSIDISEMFAKYFLELFTSKVELISNYEISKDFKKSNEGNTHLRVKFYNTIDELIENLKRSKPIDFKLIIDISELYNYKVSDNKIIKDQIELNINEYFPNSKVIRIKNLSDKSLKELEEYINSLNDNDYAYNSNKYYYKDEELNATQVFNKVKKLLK